MVKNSLFLVFFIFISTHAVAGPIEITISCSDVEYISIYYVPENVILEAPGCEKDCYFPSYTINYEASLQLQQKINTYKEFFRNIYLDDFLLIHAEPSQWDMPLSPDIMSEAIGFHATYDEALAHGLAICPKAPVRPGSRDMFAKKHE